MNRLYSTNNAGGTHAWIVAEDEDDLRVVAKVIGHVRKPENLEVNGDVTSGALADNVAGLQEILDSGYRGQVAIEIPSQRFSDLLVRIKNNVIIDDPRPKSRWVTCGKQI